MSKIQLGMLFLDSELDIQLCTQAAAFKINKIFPAGAGIWASSQMPRLRLYKLLFIARQQIALQKIQAHQHVGNYILITVFWIVYTWMTNIEYKHDENGLQKYNFQWSKLPTNAAK